MADGRRRCLGHLLLAALLPRRSGRLPRAPHTSLPLSLTLPRSHPLPWISPSLTRESPPMLLATTAATATSSLPLCVPELSPDPKPLYVDPPKPGCPKTMPRRFFPDHGRRMPPSDSSSPPSPRARRPALRTHCELLRLPSLFPASIAPCSLDPTGAGACLPPSMSLSRLEPTCVASEHAVVLSVLPGTQST